MRPCPGHVPRYCVWSDIAVLLRGGAINSGLGASFRSCDSKKCSRADCCFGFSKDLFCCTYIHASVSGVPFLFRSRPGFLWLTSELFLPTACHQRQRERRRWPTNHGLAPGCGGGLERTRGHICLRVLFSLVCAWQFGGGGGGFEGGAYRSFRRAVL